MPTHSPALPHHTFSWFLKGFRLLLLGLVCAVLQPKAQAVGTLVSAPGRVDMVYDGGRDVLYISAGATVLRYQVGTNTYLPPFQLSGSLGGIDLSPDGNTLAVADRAHTDANVWIWIIDLRTGTPRQAFFPRDGAGAGYSLGEGGIFTVAFGGDGAVYTSSTYQGSGGGEPIRRYDPATGALGTIGNVTQNTMLTTSGDGNVIAYAQGNISSGPFGRYRISDNSSLGGGQTQWFNYEIGVNHDGTQYAVPTFGGTFIYDAGFKLITTLGVYAGGQPIGVAYHPSQNLVYFTWATTHEIRAYNSVNFNLVATYDFEQTFNHPGNQSFNSGRLKLSRDGSLLFALVNNGVRFLRVGPAPPPPTPTPGPTPIVGATPTPIPVATPTPIPGPPTISFTTPTGGATLSTLPAAMGTAKAFLSSTLNRVTLTFRRNSDSQYWNGSAWVAVPTELTAHLTGNTWSLSQDDVNGLPAGPAVTTGGYTLVATAYDDAGKSASATVTVTLGVGDVKPPTLRLTNPTDGSFVNSLAPITGTAIDNDGGTGMKRVVVIVQRLSDSKYWSGSAWGDSATPLTTQLSTPVKGGPSNWVRNAGLPNGAQLSEGDYQIEVDAYDQANNKSARIIVVRLDKSPPVNTFLVPLRGAAVNGLILIRGSTQDNAGGSGLRRAELTIRRSRDGYYWNGAAWSARSTILSASLVGGSWMYKPNFTPATLPDGLYTLESTVYDRAGNRGVTANPIRVDTVAPSAVRIGTPPNGATVNSLTILQGNATDNTGGSGIRHVDLFLLRRSDGKFWSGSSWGTNPVALTTTLSGTGTVTWTRSSGLPGGTNLLDGSYALAVLAFDGAGNLKRADSTFTIRTATAALRDISSLTLSTATAIADTASVALTFTGSLDAESAGDTTNYSVEVNGQAVAIESAVYNAAKHRVVLELAANGMRTGDTINVRWNNLRDSQGQPCFAQVGPISVQ